MDTADTLYHLIHAACPGATVDCWVRVTGGGMTIRTTRCCASIIHPQITGTLRLEAHSPEAAVDGLAARWAKARRAWDTDRVLEYCERDSGGLDEDTREAMRNDLLAAGSKLLFEEFAAKCRKQAQALGQQQAA